MMYNLNKYMRNFQREGQRLGQSLSNSLHILDRDLYDKITGTELDCFYNDDIVEDIIKMYEERMKMKCIYVEGKECTGSLDCENLCHQQVIKSDN